MKSKYYISLNIVIRNQMRPFARSGLILIYAILKNVQNTHGGVKLLACNFTKSNTLS